MAITQLYIKGQQDVYFSPPFFQSSFQQHNPISKHVLQQEPEPRYSYQQHYFIFILSSLWRGCISILSWSSLSQCSTLTNNHHTIGWHVYIFKHILSLSFGAPDHRIYIHNIAPSISFVSGVPGEHVLDRMLFFFPLSSPHMYTFIMFIHIAYIFAFNLSSFLSYHLHKDELSTMSHLFSMLPWRCNMLRNCVCANIENKLQLGSTRSCQAPITLEHMLQLVFLSSCSLSPPNPQENTRPSIQIGIIGPIWMTMAIHYPICKENSIKKTPFTLWPSSF